jgi:hypothetical protein
MPTAIDHHTTSTIAPPAPSRRAALRFSTAAIIASLTTPALAQPTPGPDAKLLRLCARFQTQHRLVLTLANAAGDTSDALDWAMIKRWGISDKIAAITAVTDAGKRAKAEVAIALLEENKPFGGFEVTSGLPMRRCST